MHIAAAWQQLPLYADLFAVRFGSHFKKGLSRRLRFGFLAYFALQSFFKRRVRQSARQKERCQVGILRN